MFGKLFLRMLFLLVMLSINNRAEPYKHTNTEHEHVISSRDELVLTTYRRLMYRYNKHVRPNFSGAATVVDVHLSILSFGKINERDMTFTTDVSLVQYWYDYRLRHNLTQPLTPLMGRMKPSDLIWVPDSIFVNAMSANAHFVTVANDKLDIYSDGRVAWFTRASVESSCLMHFQKYPMDTQKCIMGVGSYAYPMKHVEYRWMNTDKIKPVVIEHGEMAQFDITGLRPFHVVEQYSLGNYSITHVEFTFVRRLEVSIIQIFFPTTSIVAVSWTSFFVHKNCVSPRISFGILTLLALSYLWSSVNMRMPKVAYIKAVDKYFMVSFSFILISLLEYTVVMNSDFRRKKEKRKDSNRKVSIIQRKMLPNSSNGTLNISCSANNNQDKQSDGNSSNGKKNNDGSAQNCYSSRSETISINNNKCDTDTSSRSRYDNNDTLSRSRCDNNDTLSRSRYDNNDTLSRNRFENETQIGEDIERKYLEAQVLDLNESFNSSVSRSKRCPKKTAEEENSMASQITKRKHNGLNESKKKIEIINIDNRGTVSSIIYTTEDTLRKDNIVDPVLKKHDTNNHRTPSRLDIASRILFPLSFLVFNIYFWCYYTLV